MHNNNNTHTNTPRKCAFLIQWIGKIAVAVVLMGVIDARAASESFTSNFPILQEIYSTQLPPNTFKSLTEAMQDLIKINKAMVKFKTFIEAIPQEILIPKLIEDYEKEIDTVERFLRKEQQSLKQDPNNNTTIGMLKLRDIDKNYEIAYQYLLTLKNIVKKMGKLPSE